MLWEAVCLKYLINLKSTTCIKEYNLKRTPATPRYQLFLLNLFSSNHTCLIHLWRISSSKCIRHRTRSKHVTLVCKPILGSYGQGILHLNSGRRPQASKTQNWRLRNRGADGEWRRSPDPSIGVENPRTKCQQKPHTKNYLQSIVSTNILVDMNKM